jgi:hypothetical protein
MKFITLILLFLSAFMGFFFVLSLIGTLWFNYLVIITSVEWFITYTILIGWWLGGMSVSEYYDKNREYFE